MIAILMVCIQPMVYRLRVVFPATGIKHQCLPGEMMLVESALAVHHACLGTLLWASGGCGRVNRGARIVGRTRSLIAPQV